MAYNYSAEERITKARITIMRDPRFVAMAGIMMIGTWKVKDIPNPSKPGVTYTAKTNGRSEIYYRQFVDKLTERQLVFLIAHETFHKMLRHRWTWKKIKHENPELANIAMDFVINGMLDNSAGDRVSGGATKIMEFIPGGCLDHAYDGMDTMQVYNLLKKNAQGGQRPKGSSTDQHDFDDDEFDDEEPLTPEEEKALEHQIDMAIRQGQRSIGKQASDMDRAIGQLLEAKIPWEDELRDFITTTCAGRDNSTWRRPSRRWVSRGVYMPSAISESVEEIVIGIDTSGSISENELRRFLSEIHTACVSVSPKKVHIIYWDAAVASHEEYEGEAVQNLTDSTKPRGGGGTDIGAFFNHINKCKLDPACVIVFTDGYTPWPPHGLKAPLLVCITSNEKAPYGRNLKVEI